MFGGSGDGILAVSLLVRGTFHISLMNLSLLCLHCMIFMCISLSLFILVKGHTRIAQHESLMRLLGKLKALFHFTSKIHL